MHFDGFPRLPREAANGTGLPGRRETGRPICFLYVLFPPPCSHPRPVYGNMPDNRTRACVHFTRVSPSAKSRPPRPSNAQAKVLEFTREKAAKHFGSHTALRPPPLSLPLLKGAPRLEHFDAFYFLDENAPPALPGA